jgi:hypothetical protein
MDVEVGEALEEDQEVDVEALLRLLLGKEEDKQEVKQKGISAG